MWKNLNDDRDRGKIKVQKYLKNAIKNKLICHDQLARVISERDFRETPPN